MNTSTWNLFGKTATIVSIICMVCSPASGLVQNNLDPASHPGGSLKKLIKSGEIEDFDRIEYTDPFGGTYIALIDTKQKESPLLTLYKNPSYVTGFAVTQEGYDTNYCITYEDETKLVMELDQYGTYAGKIVYDRDPVTDEVWMSVYDRDSYLVSNGPLKVAITNGINSEGRWVWLPFINVVCLIIVVVEVVIRLMEPPAPPNIPVVSGYEREDGTIVTIAAWPDGRSVTTSIAPDGTVIVSTFDPNKTPSTEVTTSNSPESPQNAKPN